MIVHVFNPSHDEALAINRTQYCPSAAARKTGAMFWDVAKHWADGADAILRLPPDGSLRGAVFCRVADGVECAAERFDWSCVDRIEPWGWDRHIVGVLQKLGAPSDLLPTEATLDTIRLLSSRLTAVRVLEALSQPPFVSRWCTDEPAIRAALEAYDGAAILKQPWSCSGRGVWRCTTPDWAADGAACRRARKTLRDQGAVEVEPIFECLADFAMEFWAGKPAATADAGKTLVRYEGLSFFETHDGGAYAGNVVAPQEELRRRLESLAPPPLLSSDGHLPLESLAERLCSVLADVLGDAYSGPLGVDMMLTPAGIHPCIEVNLRNTMGRVALFQQRT